MRSALAASMAALTLSVSVAANMPSPAAGPVPASRTQVLPAVGCVGPGCVPTQAYEAAAAAPMDTWSGWLSVYGDTGISYRWRRNTYGGDISPDCEVELRNSTGQVSFRFKVSYNGGEEAGVAYGITHTDTFTEVVNPCRWVSSVTVTEVRRR
jgi:hypothetical protein